MRTVVVMLLSLVVICCHAALPLNGDDSSTSRIVSLQPAVTLTILALGKEAQLVGISTYCRDLSPTLAGKPIVGDLLTPKLEALLRLQPNVVILHPSQTELKAALTKSTIRFVEVKSDTFADAVAMVVTCEEETGSTTHVLSEILKQLETPKLNDTNSSRTLVVVAREQGLLSHVYACVPGSYHDSLLSFAGGRNALEPANYANGQISVPLSIEQLVRINPDVIIDLSTNSNADALHAFCKLPSINAVKTHSVYGLKSNATLIPGAFAQDAVSSFSEVLKHASH